jgi:uroporphyrinogen-III synthase
MPKSLEGRAIALAENRQLEDLAQMLLAEGASILRYPLVSILDAPDEAPVLAWLNDMIAGRFNLVIFFTGEGVRRLLGFADRAGIRPALLAALGTSRLLTRGPKPVQALKEVGITVSKVAAAPTTDGVIASLGEEVLQGKTVGVQLYSESNPPLAEFLAAAGATMVSVLPYMYAPAADGDRVAELIGRLAGGEVDVLVFTSSPQIDRLLEVAKERHLDNDLTVGLARTKIAAVGPVIRDHLEQLGIRVSICPEQGFVMKNLVKHIRTAFES